MAIKKAAKKKSPARKAVAQRRPVKTAPGRRQIHYVEMDPVQSELQKLQLEELKLSLEQKKAAMQMRKLEAANQEEQFRKSREDERATQRGCNHRKGGKDKAGIGRGNDSDYSVVKHTYPNMEPSVLCTRCQMDWRRGDTEKKLHTGLTNHTGISFETAMQWPTDNEPSSATFFLIPAGDSALTLRIQQLQMEIQALRSQGIEVAA